MRRGMGVRVGRMLSWIIRGLFYMLKVGLKMRGGWGGY